MRLFFLIEWGSTYFSRSRTKENVEIGLKNLYFNKLDPPQNVYVLLGNSMEDLSLVFVPEKPYKNHIPTTEWSPTKTLEQIESERFHHGWNNINRWRDLWVENEKRN